MAKQNVLWLQVTMDDVFESERLDGGGDLPKEHADRVLGESALCLEVIRQITFGDEKIYQAKVYNRM